MSAHNHGPAEGRGRAVSRILLCAYGAGACLGFALGIVIGAWFL